MGQLMGHSDRYDVAWQQPVGFPADLVGPRMPRAFQPSGATLLQMGDDVKSGSG